MDKPTDKPTLIKDIRVRYGFAPGFAIIGVAAGIAIAYATQASVWTTVAWMAVMAVVLALAGAWVQPPQARISELEINIR